MQFGHMKDKYYGILVTYNPFVNKWCAFSRGDEKYYWIGEAKTVGKGDSPVAALENYFYIIDKEKDINEKVSIN